MGEHEGAVLGLLGVVVAVVVDGVEVDAGAPLHGGEEGRGDAGAHPDRVTLELLVRQDPAAAVAAAVHGWCRLVDAEAGTQGGDRGC